MQIISGGLGKNSSISLKEEKFLLRDFMFKCNKNREFSGLERKMWLSG